MALLKGVLKNAFGEPMPNHTIVFTALKNTQTVLNTVISEIVTDENGAYEKHVYQGRYQVDIYKDGIQKTTAGIIELYSNSPDADINTYLTLPGEAEVTPEFIQQVIELKNQAIQAADSALASKADAKSSADKSEASSSAAKQSESNAKASENSASDSKDLAQQAAASADGDASLVSGLAQQVSSDSASAAQSASAAASSEASASDSEAKAADSAATAKSYADSIDPAALVASVNGLTGKAITLAAKDIRTAIDASVGLIDRDLGEILGERKSVKDFGAKGNNSTDDTAAFNKAAAWAAAQVFGATITVPPGIYILKARIEWNGAGAQVGWRGDGVHAAQLSWTSDSTSQGFYAGATAAVARTKIEGITFITSKVTTASAVQIFSARSSPKSLVMKQCNAYGGAVGGVQANGYWAGGFVWVSNPVYPSFEELFFFGIGGASSVDKSNLIPNCFTIVANNGGVFFANFNNCFGNNINNGIMLSTKIEPGIEGTVITGCNFNSVNVAVSADATGSGNANYLPPQIHIMYSQFEFMQRAINISKHSKIFISNVLSYSDPTANDAINHINLVDVETAIISDSVLETRSGDTGCDGIVVSGASKNVSAHHNQIDVTAAHVAIVYGGSSRNCTHDNNKIITTANEYVNSSSNAATNTAASYEGTDQASYQTGKYIEKSGSVIINVDSSGVGTVNYTQAFPNKVITLILTNGDSGNPGGSSNGVEIQTSNATGFVVKFEAAAAGARRVNFIAKGR